MTDLPNTNALILDLRRGWLTIWLNTPENRNALSEELAGELRAVLYAIRDNRAVRGITLRGKGGVFCAGGDLKAFMASLQGEASHDNLAAINKAGGELFQIINELPQVTIALVEGAAIAGGLGMVCCADIVVVAKDAKFALTETQLGIPPAQIAPYVVQRIGLNAARRLMLTGARFAGAEAKSLGLADYVADDAASLDRIEQEIKAGVMGCAPGANAAVKEILFASMRLSQEDMLDLAADRFARCLGGDEGREGVMSYIEKRKPNWATE